MSYSDIICTVVGLLFIAGAAGLCWAIATAQDDPEAGVIEKE